MHHPPGALSVSLWKVNRPLRFDTVADGMGVGSLGRTFLYTCSLLSCNGGQVMTDGTLVWFPFHSLIKLAMRCHVQGNFLIDGAVAQFRLGLVRCNTRQCLVDVSHHCNGARVIYRLDLATWLKVSIEVTSAVGEEEPGILFSNVVPSMRVLDLHQSALPLAGQTD